MKKTITLLSLIFLTLPVFATQCSEATYIYPIQTGHVGDTMVLLARTQNNDSSLFVNIDFKVYDMHNRLLGEVNRQLAGGVREAAAELHVTDQLVSGTYTLRVDETRLSVSTESGDIELVEACSQDDSVPFNISTERQSWNDMHIQIELDNLFNWGVKRQCFEKECTTSGPCPTVCVNVTGPVEWNLAVMEPNFDFTDAGSVVVEEGKPWYTWAEMETLKRRLFDSTQSNENISTFYANLDERVEGFESSYHELKDSTTKLNDEFLVCVEDLKTTKDGLARCNLESEKRGMVSWWVIAALILANILGAIEGIPLGVAVLYSYLKFFHVSESLEEGVLM